MSVRLDLLCDPQVDRHGVPRGNRDVGCGHRGNAEPGQGDELRRVALDVKTLSDPARRSVDFHAQLGKVARLRKLEAPGTLSTDTPRQAGIEKQVYRVRAQVVTAIIEDDSDIHLVIATRGHRKQSMIVELPDPACVDSRFKRAEIRNARSAMLSNCGPISFSSFTDLKGKVVVSGVGFWDEIHGQTGVAPNGIELHPVLGFTGTCSRT
jgi:hypothetical protein